MVGLYAGFAGTLVLQSVTHDTVLFLVVLAAGFLAALFTTNR